MQCSPNDPLFRGEWFVLMDRYCVIDVIVLISASSSITAAFSCLHMIELL